MMVALDATAPPASQPEEAGSGHPGRRLEICVNSRATGTYFCGFLRIAADWPLA
jgi:hypothetical protein